MRLGIDASNIRGGGGIIHLQKILELSEPKKHHINKITIWGGEIPLKYFPKKPWLELRKIPNLNHKILKRYFWQQTKLEKWANECCDLLFIPGGFYLGDFRPYVTMFQNMQIFESKEVAREGFSKERLRLNLLKWIQSKTFQNASGLICLSEYSHNYLAKFYSEFTSNIPIQMIAHGAEKIIPVHINGRNANLKEIMKIAKIYGISVVEDAAQALESKFQGKSLGTIANVGVISLAPTKIITSGQGGLILTNDQKISDTIIKLKDHGRLMRSWNYHPEIGFNFKYNDILAALALVQLKKLSERLEKAKTDFIQYSEGLEEINEIEFFRTNFEDGNVPLWVDIKFKGNRESFIEYMSTKNITCRPFWPPIHKQNGYKKFYTSPLPNTEEISSNSLWLPSGPNKTKKDINRVINEIKKFF